MKDPLPLTPTAPQGVLPAGFQLTAGIGFTSTTTSVGGEVELGDHGLLGDVRLAYRMTLNGWMVAPYAEVSFADASSSGMIGGTETIGYSFGAMVGHSIDETNTLIAYVIGGYQGEHFGINNTGFASDLSGFRIGGGLEKDFRNGFMISVEGRYLDFSDWSPPSSGVSVSNNAWQGMLRAGFNF